MRHTVRDCARLFGCCCCCCCCCVCVCVCVCVRVCVCKGARCLASDDAERVELTRDTARDAAGLGAGSGACFPTPHLAQPRSLIASCRRCVRHVSSAGNGANPPGASFTLTAPFLRGQGSASSLGPVPVAVPQGTSNAKSLFSFLFRFLVVGVGKSDCLSTQNTFWNNFPRS